MISISGAQQLSLDITEIYIAIALRHIPLPHGSGQVELPAAQVDLSKVFFWNLYKQIWKMHYFQASKKFFDPSSPA